MSSSNHTYHDAAPTNHHGYPVHPEENYPICGRTKSDRTTPNGKQRPEPYCTLRAGWGVEDGSAPGDACKFHGGAGGAPEGPRHGQWTHGLYSEYFSSADAAHADRWIELADGERLAIEDFARMAEKVLLYEFVRIERAMSQAPAPDQAGEYCCRRCGQPLSTVKVKTCPGCETALTADTDVCMTAEWVDMHDHAISKRIQRWLGLLKTYTEVIEEADLTVNFGVTFEEAIRRAQELAGSDHTVDTPLLDGERLP